MKHESEISDLVIDKALRGELSADEMKLFEARRAQNKAFNDRVVEIESLRDEFQARELPAWLRNRENVAIESETLARASFFEKMANVLTGRALAGLTMCAFAAVVGVNFIAEDSAISGPGYQPGVVRRKGETRALEIHVLEEKEGRVREVPPSMKISNEKSYKIRALFNSPQASAPASRAQRVILIGEDSKGRREVYQSKPSFYDVEGRRFDFPGALKFEPVGEFELLHVALCDNKFATELGDKVDASHLAKILKRCTTETRRLVFE